MPHLARFRHVAHRRLWRGVWAFALLGLVLAGMPRWEIHAHEVTRHAHAHAGEVVDHHAADALAASAHADAVHVHVVATPSAACVDAEPARFTAVPPLRWSVPRDTGRLATGTWPPPQRPPIA